MAEPILESGENLVTCCPLCRAPFRDAVETNAKFTCPSCDAVVSVRVYYDP